MHLSLRAFSLVTFLIGAAVPVALALTPPAWVDEEFRACVAAAVDHEMEGRIEAQRQYGDAQVHDLETYRSELQAAYQIADEKGRRDALRNADKANRDRMRETKRVFDDAIRQVRSESRDAQRECATKRRDHDRFTRTVCTGSEQCSGNRVCSTERGVCDPSCPPDADHCVQVCAGTCERVTSSRGSSSSGPSGPHMWNGYQSNGQVCRGSGECSAGYFCSTTLGECNSPCAPGVVCTQVCQGRCLLFPLDQANSSSRSSRAPGQGGVNCQPYQCPDGREFPSCTPEGYPINYFQNPCYT